MFVPGSTAAQSRRTSERPVSPRPDVADRPGGQVPVFVYGALQEPRVQALALGRTLRGSADRLPGFTLTVIEPADPELISATGSSRHPMAVLASDSSARVRGTLYRLDPSDLESLDRWYGAPFHRLRLRLDSGAVAWVYVDRPPRLRSRARPAPSVGGPAGPGGEDAPTVKV